MYSLLAAQGSFWGSDQTCRSRLGRCCMLAPVASYPLPRSVYSLLRHRYSAVICPISVRRLAPHARRSMCRSVKSRVVHWRQTDRATPTCIKLTLHVGKSIDKPRVRSLVQLIMTCRDALFNLFASHNLAIQFLCGFVVVERLQTKMSGPGGFATVAPALD